MAVPEGCQAGGVPAGCFPFVNSCAPISARRPGLVNFGEALLLPIILLLDIYWFTDEGRRLLLQLFRPNGRVAFQIT
jgi:hypothetical protein